MAVQDPQSAPVPLSDGARSTISLLLFFHLAALALAITAGALPASPLRGQLGRVPILKQYMELLNLDSGYTFQLTDDSRLDADHFVEMELNYGKSENHTLPLTPAGVGVGPRGERYRNLAVNVARRLSDELGDSEVESLLPAAISRKLLAEEEITQGRHRFRLRRLLPLAREQALSTDLATSDPFQAGLYQNAYEADVTFYKGEPQLIRVSSALESSPVQRP